MASYLYEQDDDGKVVFHVTPDRLRFPWKRAILLPPFGLFFGAILAGVLQSVWPFLATLAFIVGVLVFRWRARTANRKPHNFSVSSEGIHLPEQTIPADRIHRLVIRNPISNVERPYGTGPGIIVTSGGALGATQAAAGAVGQGLASAANALACKDLNDRERISYQIDAEAGGKATTVARGMDETCAYGLLQDVTRALGGEWSRT